MSSLSLWSSNFISALCAYNREGDVMVTPIQLLCLCKKLKYICQHVSHLSGSPSQSACLSVNLLPRLTITCLFTHYGTFPPAKTRTSLPHSLRLVLIPHCRPPAKPAQLDNKLSFTDSGLLVCVCFWFIG